MSAPQLPEPQSNAPTLGDIANGRRFVEMHGRDILYVPQWKQWLVWDDDRWSEDCTLEIQRMAKATSNVLWDEAKAGNDTELAREAKRIQGVAGLRAMLEAASSEQAVIVQPKELDTDLWLLNTPTGTVNLRTGHLKNADRHDLITKMTGAGFDPEGKCPLWEKTLSEVLVKEDGSTDQDLIDFFQRFCGYCLTGSTEEQLFAILHGEGRNGKGVLTGTLSDMLGEYGRTMDAGLLLVQRNDPHPAWKANLCGRRFVVSQETDSRRKLNEAQMKDITGGDAISTRRMHENWWEFIPQFKLLLATNHKPEITGTDEGVWSRIRLIPFNRFFKPEERDPDLKAKLKVEWPGILRWAVLGCELWSSEGKLAPPEAVQKATEAYREESDETRRFVRDVFNVGPVFADAHVSVNDGYRLYQLWAGAEGIDVDRRLSPTALGKALHKLGYAATNKYINGKVERVRLGLGIKEVTP